MKKFASILLAGLMALSLFAGCSSEVTSTDDGQLRRPGFQQRDRISGGIPTAAQKMLTPVSPEP